ncbi:DUF742 domain-containing protein [Saccharomonospora piscinae]|uniref:DUF742 domain-containing protein n=1 Tax=Saccharomonospora piscinae TaxID=687388 RepID=A0A1V9A0B3_SACPI|nr:DUF742 domain-containing protein [Saccharomonospora piscinae]OQO90599.1 hypothetical protein B1813_13650 [Saccharomonospora piscinae]TLW93266.1 DUF742 domain-containing protein [Saccharomonospora piscinae]
MQGGDRGGTPDDGDGDQVRDEADGFPFARSSRRPRPERVVMSPRDAFAEGDADGPAVDRLRARPYVLTKGRTRARSDLAVETLVSADPQAQWQLHKSGSEYRKLGTLCSHPVSVAEIAANLAVPLGVARVLISDLADTGFVHVHSAPVTVGGRPDEGLMHRVLEGLRRL